MTEEEDDPLSTLQGRLYVGSPLNLHLFHELLVLQPWEPKEFNKIHPEIFESPEGDPPDFIPALFPPECELQVLDGHVAVFEINEVGQAPELSPDPKGKPLGKEIDDTAKTSKNEIYQILGQLSSRLRVTHLHTEALHRST